MSNVDNNRNQAINQLFRGILTLKDIDECYRFFGDLFTVQELSAFAQRFQVAELLAQGSTYDGVREKIPTSYSTITRINTELRYGSGGYSMVFERLKAEQDGDAAQLSLRNFPFT